MQEKIIVRNKVFRKGELASKLIMMNVENKFDSVKSFREYLGDNLFMKELFGEDIDNNYLENSDLFKKYEEICTSGIANSMFTIMHKIKNDLAVSLSEHIYLHHISDNVFLNNERIVPWECIDSKIYISDTWWEKDEEIIFDLTSLSLVEFMAKYKGY